MRTKLNTIDPEAEQLLPPNQPDGSGVGVNYVDAVLKPLNTTLDDGTAIVCKRKGLRIMLKIGENQGDALMSLHNDGPDPKVIFEKAFKSAAENAGAAVEIEGGSIFLVRPDQ